MEKKGHIQIYDFKNNSIIFEKIPAVGLLAFLYHNDSISATSLREFISKNSFVSSLVGMWMKMPWTRKSIPHFCKTYHVNLLDFEAVAYKSFNDFFTRKLQPDARPIDHFSVIAPCDGRYFCYQDLSHKNSFFVKGQTFSLAKLLNDENLANVYKNGSMIISRLAPVDYHRFHFPVEGKITKITPISGSLYSVNPLALREKIQILTQNKRIIVEITSEKYGNVIQILVGATSVGTIHLTAKQDTLYKKGEELGYFSFGGSMIITLFQRDTIHLNKKILQQTEEQIETLLQMGTSLEEDQ